jgi:hypothetical protein
MARPTAQRSAGPGDSIHDFSWTTPHDRHLLRQTICAHRHEVTRTGMRRQQQGTLWQELLVSMNQSIDYPSKCKFGFHSVLANTLEPPRHDQGLRSTVFRIVCLLLKAGNSQTVLDTYGTRARSIDCSLFIVHILQLLVQLIVPLINYWQQTLSRSHPLHPKQVPRRCYEHCCCRRCKRKPFSSNF